MKTTYFLLLLVFTALGSSIMTLYAPIVVTHIKRLFTRKKRTTQPDCRLMEHNIEELVKRINELEEQIGNVAKNHYRREQNRKNNIRRTVKELLQEIYDGKFDK